MQEAFMETQVLSMYCLRQLTPTLVKLQKGFKEQEQEIPCVW